jgi:hypothetical protein
VHATVLEGVKRAVPCKKTGGTGIPACAGTERNVCAPRVPFDVPEFLYTTANLLNCCAQVDAGRSHGFSNVGRARTGYLRTIGGDKPQESRQLRMQINVPADRIDSTCWFVANSSR